MKRAFLSAVLTAALCAAFGGVGFAQTEVERGRVVRLPGATSLTNPCNGEQISLSGFVHVSYQEIFSDGQLKYFRFHLNPQGIEGVGETGAKYRGTGAETEVFRAQGSGPFNFYWVQNIGLVGQGPDNNLSYQLRQKLSILPDGSIESEILEQRLECR